jgi:hypothetical protein
MHAERPPRLQIRTAYWRYIFHFSVFPENLLRPGDVNVKGLQCRPHPPDDLAGP